MSIHLPCCSYAAWSLLATRFVLGWFLWKETLAQRTRASGSVCESEPMKSKSGSKAGPRSSSKNKCPLCGSLSVVTIPTAAATSVGTSGGPRSASLPHEGRVLPGTTTVKDGIVFTVDARGLTLRTIDYHCPPVHVRREELQRMGFVLLTLGRRRLQPSPALAWRHSGSRWTGRGSLPEGLVLDGYVLARVRAGIDVFVTSHGAQELCVGPDQLREVGLRVRSQASSLRADRSSAPNSRQQEPRAR